MSDEIEQIIDRKIEERFMRVGLDVDDPNSGIVGTVDVELDGVVLDRNSVKELKSFVAKMLGISSIYVTEA